MANTEYITIKNASRKVLNRMRQIGIDKAQRLQEVQKRWDAGEYKNTEIVQLWIVENYIGDKKGLIAGMWSALLR